MKYKVPSRLQEALSGLVTSQVSLDDEVALVRLTVQDLLDAYSLADNSMARLTIGSMLRDAVETLSRIVERMAKLPKGNDYIPASMLYEVIQRIDADVTAGPAKDLLINDLQAMLKGISNRDEVPHITRTCELMDRSVPYVPSQVLDFIEEP
jgi:hypothetical protein